MICKWVDAIFYEPGVHGTKSVRFLIHVRRFEAVENSETELGRFNYVS